MIYEPREDSYLLAKYVKKYAKGRVLDIGTGSGIQAMTAAKLNKVKSVLAIDIQKEVIEHCRQTIKSRKISFRCSNLFENVSGKFDAIIFNPPYLPEDVKLKDITIDGGKKGFEVLERFFDSVNGFLSSDGIILIVFSSLTNKDKVNEFVSGHLLEYKELEMQRIFFEELYVYLIKKSEVLKMLEKKKIAKIKRLAKGHRGLIFTGMLKNKKVAVKIQRKDIGTSGTVNKEAKGVKLLNRHGMGPKFLFAGKDYFAYEFVEGVFIPEFLEKAIKADIIKVLKDVFAQCYKMDTLGLNKEEMHHPYKHIIVGKNNKATLIDFERLKKTRVENSFNVTQFCQYVTSSKFRALVSGKIIIDEKRTRKIAAEYKKNKTKKNFNDILDNIK